MDCRALYRRIPWLLPLLVACGDDGGGGDGETGTATGTVTGNGPGPGSTGDQTAVPSESGASTGSNTAPEAADDVLFATQGVTLEVGAADGVLVNDTDADGDTLTVTLADSTSTGGGTVAVAEDGSLSYASAADYWGPDTFTYTISDGGDGVGEATVTIYVAPVVIPLSAVAGGRGGFSIDGYLVDDWSGFAVSKAGDLNNDGMDDVFVGAPGPDDPLASSDGRTYLVSGKVDTDPVDLAQLATGMGGFSLDGEDDADRFGISVSGAIDFNNDDDVDLVIGASGVDAAADEAGRTYIVLTGGGATLLVDGEGLDHASGRSVSEAGDVNGDGRGDIIIGAAGAGPSGVGSGRAYVVFGKGNTNNIQLGNVADGQGGFPIDGEAADDMAGLVVSGAGDVNGDGLDDVLVAAPGAANRAYVVFGKDNEDAVLLADVAMGMGGFVVEGGGADDTPLALGRAGDINDDGMDDVLVGTPAASRAYVVLGKGGTQAVDLADIASGMGGFVLEGEAAGDQAGVAVAGAGDVNGDGLADVIVGADGAAPNGNASGRSYVVFGKNDTDAVQLTDVVGGAGGYVLDGEAGGDRSGRAVSAAGDVNGDGLDDLLIGAYQADPNGDSDAGRSYVVFGVPTPDTLDFMP